ERRWLRGSSTRGAAGRRWFLCTRGPGGGHTKTSGTPKQGKVVHLSFHVWWAVADGFVRLQAGVAESGRENGEPGAAPKRGETGDAAREQAEMGAAWGIGALVLGCPAPLVPASGQASGNKISLCGFFRAWIGHDPDEQRAGHPGPSFARFVAAL